MRRAVISFRVVGDESDARDHDRRRNKLDTSGQQAAWVAWGTYGNCAEERRSVGLHHESRKRGHVPLEHIVDGVQQRDRGVRGGGLDDCVKDSNECALVTSRDATARYRVYPVYDEQGRQECYPKCHENCGGDYVIQGEVKTGRGIQVMGRGADNVG